MRKQILFYIIIPFIIGSIFGMMLADLMVLQMRLESLVRQQRIREQVLKDLGLRK